MDPENSEDIHVSGTEIVYLHVCKRKLWLFRHGIRPESENVNVQLGRLIHDESFSRQEKDIQIGDAAVIDWANFKDGVIHETKKGKTPGKGDVEQVKFYMYQLKKRGLRVTSAKIHYPAAKRTVDVPWEDDIIPHVEQKIDECKKVILSEKIPPLVLYPYCKSCAYQELCYI